MEATAGHGGRTARLLDHNVEAFPGPAPTDDAECQQPLQQSGSCDSGRRVHHDHCAVLGAVSRRGLTLSLMHTAFPVCHTSGGVTPWTGRGPSAASSCRWIENPCAGESLASRRRRLLQRFCGAETPCTSMRECAATRASAATHPAPYLLCDGSNDVDGPRGVTPGGFVQRVKQREAIRHVKGQLEHAF